MQIYKKRHLSRLFVSILVFVELALDAREEEAARINKEKAEAFQSLFSWNLLLMYLQKRRR